MRNMYEMVKSHPELFWKISDIRAYFPSLFARSVQIQAKQSVEKDFLLIFGAGRSGNTLLRRLLMEDLSIYIPPETYVLPKLTYYRVAARRLGWQALVDLFISSFEYHHEFETFKSMGLRQFALEAKSWEIEKQGITNLICQLYDAFANEANVHCDWVGDKTPINTLHAGPIKKFLPKAKYVYLYRDGVDVSVSYVKAGIYNNLADASTRWVNSHKSWSAFKKRLNGESYIEVSYEDLVSDPDQVISNIANKFGIPKRGIRLDVRAILGDVTSRKHHSNSLSKPGRSSIGKGRESITPKEREMMRTILNGTLSELGYDSL